MYFQKVAKCLQEISFSTFLPVLMLFVPNVYAGGARSDWSDFYDNVEGAPECWQDGYDDGLGHPFDRQTQGDRRL